MRYRLVEKINGMEGTVLEFATPEELQAKKSELLATNPSAVLEEIDMEEILVLLKVKEQKKKIFEFKGTTIAKLREELNEWVQLQKE